MSLTVDDLDNLRHMLGVSEQHRRGHRNYFVAGSDAIPSMERLLSAGFVVKSTRPNGLSNDPCYFATLDGAQVVGLQELPA